MLLVQLAILFFWGGGGLVVIRASCCDFELVIAGSVGNPLLTRAVAWHVKFVHMGLAIAYHGSGRTCPPN